MMYFTFGLIELPVNRCSGIAKSVMQKACSKKKKEKRDSTSHYMETNKLIKKD